MCWDKFTCVIFCQSLIIALCQLLPLLWLSFRHKPLKRRMFSWFRGWNQIWQRRYGDWNYLCSSRNQKRLIYMIQEHWCRKWTVYKLLGVSSSTSLPWATHYLPRLLHFPPNNNNPQQVMFKYLNLWETFHIKALTATNSRK